jgi:hypothetical protein
MFDKARPGPCGMRLGTTMCPKHLHSKNCRHSEYSGTATCEIFWKNTSSKNEAAALRLFLIVRSVLSLKRSVRMGTGTKDISHRIARGPDCRAVGTVQVGLRLFAKTLHELEFHPCNVLHVTPDWRLSCRQRSCSAARWSCFCWRSRRVTGDQK